MDDFKRDLQLRGQLDGRVSVQRGGLRRLWSGPRIRLLVICDARQPPRHLLDTLLAGPDSVLDIAGHDQCCVIRSRFSITSEDYAASTSDDSIGPGTTRWR